MTPRDSDDTGYEVLAPLSSGTYGENLLAMRRDDLGVGKLFVLRHVRRGLAADKGVRDAFLEIGRRAVRLSHTNLVQTFELGGRGGALFAATEHLEGEPLDAIMAAVAPAPKAVDPRFWLLIASDVLAGLQYAHEMRDFDGSELALVHGGITPRKIVVTYSGRVVVTDFGLAALAAHAKRLEGTFLPEMVAYTAPEQREGRPCDARADVYAVGLILWELLSGRRHRQTNEPHAEFESLPPLEEISPEIDSALAAVVQRAMERDPENRWQSAAQLRTALEPFVDRDGIVRRGALGDAIGALFAKSRDKVPLLLSKRATPLAPQDVYAVTLGGAPAPQKVSEPAEEPEDEEEAPFLLGSPIEQLSDANVISVTELVSGSELLSSVELAGGGVESDATLGGEADADAGAPSSTTPLSRSDFEIPVDEGSARSVGSLKSAGAVSQVALAGSSRATSASAETGAEVDSGVAPGEAEADAGARGSEAKPAGASARLEEESPDSGERPTLTDANAVWEEAVKKSSSSPPPALRAPVEEPDAKRGEPDERDERDDKA